MKVSIAVIIALVCVVGLTLADYGSYSYMPYYPSGQQGGGGGGFGNSGFLMLIGFVFILLLLFGSNNKDTITIRNITT